MQEKTTCYNFTLIKRIPIWMCAKIYIIWWPIKRASSNSVMVHFRKTLLCSSAL